MMSWTADQAAEWERIWELPVMQAGLARLKDKCRVTGKATELPAGYDALVLAAQGYAHAQGQGSVFAEIDAMKSVFIAKELPPPFQRNPPPVQTPKE